jgi:hypothetical protein
MAKMKETAQSSSETPYRVSTVWQTLTRALFEDYRPERHYMRGRGPKWQKKHDRIVLTLQATYPQDWNEAEKMY